MDAQERRQRMKLLFNQNPMRSRKIVRVPKKLRTTPSPILNQSGSNVVVVKTTTQRSTQPPPTTQAPTTNKRQIFVTTEAPSSAPPTGKHFNFDMYTLSTLMPPKPNSEISMFDYTPGPIIAPLAPSTTTHSLSNTSPVFTTTTTVVPITTTERKAVTTARPTVASRRPAVTTRRPVVTTHRSVVTTRKPVVTTRQPTVQSTESTTQTPGLLPTVPSKPPRRLGVYKRRKGRKNEEEKKDKKPTEIKKTRSFFKNRLKPVPSKVNVEKSVVRKVISSTSSTTSSLRTRYNRIPDRKIVSTSGENYDKYEEPPPRDPRPTSPTVPSPEVDPQLNSVYELKYSKPPERPAPSHKDKTNEDNYDPEAVDSQVEELTHSIAQLRAEIARLQSQL